MAAEEAASPSPSPPLSPPPFTTPMPATQVEEGEEKVKPWRAYTTEDLKRTVYESTDSALRSVRSLQENSSTHLRLLQEYIPQWKTQYVSYEDAFFKRIKDGLTSANEHPALAGGVAIAMVLLMRGPRRFFFRQTLGRLQSEEAQFNRAEKNVKELNLSVDLMKKESRKLLERAALAEKNMKRGYNELMSTGSEIQRLAKTAYKIDSQASDLMDGLREIPGREALKLRAEVASMASLVKKQRTYLDKRIMKISELGVSV